MSENDVNVSNYVWHTIFTIFKINSCISLNITAFLLMNTQHRKSTITQPFIVHCQYALKKTTKTNTLLVTYIKSINTLVTRKKCPLKRVVCLFIYFCGKIRRRRTLSVTRRIVIFYYLQNVKECIQSWVKRLELHVVASSNLIKKLHMTGSVIGRQTRLYFLTIYCIFVTQIHIEKLFLFLYLLYYIPSS